MLSKTKILDSIIAISAIAGDKEFLYLDGDAYSASSVYVKDNGVWNLYYICRDYLGSITHLTDANGVVLQENSYDAWGRLRDPQTQVLYNDDNQPDLFLRRGYTSHEHLPWFGLTNMNARLYDPVLGRFLSPDPYVQMPDFSQSFNRYAYALNNPLKFIDPSGETPLLAAIILGAVIGGMANLNIQAHAGNINSIGDIFASFGLGALAGAAAGAVGGVVGGAIASSMSVGGGFAGGAITGAAAGFTGGFVGSASNAWYGGASFGEGLLSGLKSGAIGGLIGGATGGVISGISAHNNGYKFWNGTKINEFSVSGDATGLLDDKAYDSTINDIVLKDRMYDAYKVSEGDYGITKITTAPGDGYKLQMDYAYRKANGNVVRGYARLSQGGWSEIHISPKYSNGNITDFKAVTGHELIHTYHNYAIGYTSGISPFSERVAYNYSSSVYLEAGDLTSSLAVYKQMVKLHGIGFVPAHYRKTPFFTLK